MSTRKETKRELKRRKQAAREAARRAERRRALVTVGIVGAVVLAGGLLIALTIVQETRAEAEAEREATAAASEAAAAASEAAEQLANREVACGGDLPDTTEQDKPTFSQPEQVLEEGVDYSAVIDTSCGRIVVDLAEDRAPETVNGFVFLSGEGFYDGLEIFRNATTIGALQTGAGSNQADWQIGYTLSDELELAEQEGYPPGAVAMANAGPDSAGSQFFFVYNDSFSLDPTFTRFGTVTDGLDVLERIGEIETIGLQGESPAQVVYMHSVEISEDRSPPASATEEGTAPRPRASEG